MMIRKNTKAFKAILDVIEKCLAKSDREKLVRLFITKAGSTIKDRIAVEGIEGESQVFYDMTYQTVLNNLRSSNHQLYHSDSSIGIYFFHNSIDKSWEETPFEFDDAIKKEFGALPDGPITRKKEKAEKYVFPVAAQTKKEPKQKEEKKKDFKAKMKVVKDEKKPKGPDFKLKHDIEFSNLDDLMVRAASLTKHDVLKFYHEIADYLLPYLKDRPQTIRLQTSGERFYEYSDLKSLEVQSKTQIPDWFTTSKAADGLLCNDREHLLLYVEMGNVAFHPWHNKIKSIDKSDYILLALDSSDGDVSKVVDVALTVYKILEGLKIPSFAKTDGKSGLHIYLPLDSKSDYETARSVGEYIGKLTRLKMPDQVAISGGEDNGYGKVIIDYLLNEKGIGIIAPYSLTEGLGTVATPLSWDEVNEDLNPEAFTHEEIFRRLKQSGDLMKDLFKKKVNADELLEHLVENYSFLIE